VDGTDYYIPAAALGFARAFKIPGLLRAGVTRRGRRAAPSEGSRETGLLDRVVRLRIAKEPRSPLETDPADA